METNHFLFFTLLTLLLSLTISLDYCKTSNPLVNLYLLKDENQAIPLTTYIKGYNLQYKINNSDSATVNQTYTKLNSTIFKFQAGYQLVGIGVLNKLNVDRIYPGVVAAINADNNQIVIAQIQVNTGVQIPVVSQYLPPYVLPDKMNCFGVVITDQNYTVVIDCQDILGQKNYMCILKRDNKPDCAISQASSKTSQRKTSLYTIKDNQQHQTTYILSADVALDSTHENTILVYNLNLSIEAVAQINQTDLQLDKLAVVDMIIDPFGRILVASLSGENTFDIVSFTMKNNQPDSVTSLAHDMKGRVTAISVSLDSLFIATLQKIIQSSYPLINPLWQYQLQSKTFITHLQVNPQYLIIQTSNKQYIYQRGVTSLKQILISQDINPSSILKLHPYGNYQFIITKQKIDQAIITPGYLYVKGGNQGTNFMLTGISGQMQCIVVFNVKLVENDKIYVKKNLTLPTFTADSALQIDLSQYFGGSELQYNITPSPKNQSFTLTQIHKYTIKNGLSNMSLYQLVRFPNNTLLLAGIQDKSIIIKKCLIIDTNNIQCDIYWQYDQINESVVTMNAFTRKNGDSFLVLCYDSHKYTYLNLNQPRWNWFMQLDNYHYIQAVIGQRYSFFRLKENMIDVRFNEREVKSFDKNYFSQKQLLAMNGFYPREIKINPIYPSIFYIKTINGIAIMGVNQASKTIQLLKYQSIFDSYIPQNLWTFVIGKQTILIITPDYVTQFQYQNSLQLHKINLQSDIILPVHYDPVTDTVYAITKDGRIVIIRLNSIATDSIIYSQAVDSTKIAIGQSWLCFPQLNIIYNVPQTDKLTINGTSIPDNQFKVHQQLDMVVSGKGENISIATNITFINYQTKIKQKTDQKSAINLPSNTNGDTGEIEIPLYRYFTGWISSYKITCPYTTDNKLTLLTPVRFVNNNQYKFKGPTRDIITGEQFAIILDNQQSIFVVDSNNKLLVFITITENNVYCARVSILNRNLDTDGNRLFVFCTSTQTKTQKLLSYTITKNQIKPLLTYDLPQTDFIQNPHTINVIISPTADSDYWLVVHDIDVSVDTDEKQGSVKLFEITNSTIDMSETITSASFGLETAFPINSMDIYDSTHWFFTIGGVGVGYLQIINQSQTNQLFSTKNFKYISLFNQPSIQDYSLDNDLYQSIKVLNIDSTGNAKVFITSSNSLHLLVNLNIGQQAKFVNISETYNRMGRLPTINWVQISKQKVFIAYYNVTSNEVELGIYNRSSTNITNSHISIKIPLSQGLKVNKFAGVVGKRVLINFNVKISAYTYASPFSLIGNYTTPGTFQQIVFTAQNSISQTSHSVQVKFDGNDDGSIKWYWIVLGVVLLIMIIGLSFGYYLKKKGKKNKKSKKNKKISLMTEHDDD